ncbi:hypothetical protein N0V85_005629 [Neurospora sp. IMI 360204]|nr:hypothetical protein N0V85_005629 [Neurospora sp. IMI 360204]
MVPPVDINYTNHINNPAPPIPASGIWVPTITLFDPELDTVDFQAQAKYFSYLSSPKIGLAGFLVLGTNAETFLLTRQERYDLLYCARTSVPPGFPIMAGVSGHSTAQVQAYITDAVKAGADYVLVLPPGYFGPKGPRGGEEMIENFYDDIAKFSKLPVLIENFPAVCNGIDLSSELIIKLANRHKGKIVGTNLMCGNAGKITRLAKEFSPWKKEFAIFYGKSDYLIGGLAAGSSGSIAAFANVFPWATVLNYNDWVTGEDKNVQKDREAALRRSGILAKVEELLEADGIAAVKFAASLYTGWRAGVVNGDGKYPLARRGYKGMELFKPRKPYPDIGLETKEKIWEAVNRAFGMERDPIADGDLMAVEKKERILRM